MHPACGVPAASGRPFSSSTPGPRPAARAGSRGPRGGSVDVDVENNRGASARGDEDNTDSNSDSEEDDDEEPCAPRSVWVPGSVRCAPWCCLTLCFTLNSKAPWHIAAKVTTPKPAGTAG